MHGDDFISLGSDEEVKLFHRKMKEAYEVKIRGVLGPEAKDQKLITILNRIIEWKEDGLHYEGDGRNIEKIIEETGLKSSRGVSTPGEAAKAIASRIGHGKRTRHIAVHLLWLQERIESRDMRIFKVAGSKNPADLGTKHFSAEKMNARLEKPNMHRAGGSHHLSFAKANKEVERSRVTESGDDKSERN